MHFPGHHVTALVRDPSSLTPHKNLTVVEGSPMSEEDMNRAFAAAGTPVDAALQFLNAKRATESPFAKFIGPARLIADSTAHAAQALRKQKTSTKPRLVVMNAQGVGETRKVISFLMRFIIFHTNISKSYEDHEAVNAEIEANCGSDVWWTVAYPTALDNSGQKTLRTFKPTETGFSFFTSRESCARWMVDVATGKVADEFSNKRVLISN